jgi:hypothetical protein
MHNSGSVGDSSIQRPGTLRSLVTISRTTDSIVQIAQQQLLLFTSLDDTHFAHRNFWEDTCGVFD